MSVKSYERRLARLIRDAVTLRGAFLAEMTRLDRAPTLATARARYLGERYLPRFEAVRWEAEATPAPPGAAACQAALLRWLGRHLDACIALTRVGFGHDIRPIGEAAHHLVAARATARDFNRAHRAFAAPLAA